MGQKVFKSPFLLTDTPKMLIEQCQEITLIEEIPYMQTQLITNTVHLLLQSSVLPMKEFKDREATFNKTCLFLKMSIHSVYTRQFVIVKLCTTLGQHGYVPAQNTYDILVNGNNNTVNNATNAMITQTAAAAMPRITLGNTCMASTVPNNVTTAIKTVSTNQAVM
jgi:hypothetical protein